MRPECYMPKGIWPEVDLDTTEYPSDTTTVETDSTSVEEVPVVTTP